MSSRASSSETLLDVGRYEPERISSDGPNKVFDTYQGLCFAAPEGFGVGMPIQQLDYVYVSETFVSATQEYVSGSICFVPCEDVISNPRTHAGIVEKTLERGT